MKRGRVPSQSRGSGRGSGPGKEQAAAMMRLAGPGGVTRAARCAGSAPRTPLSASPLGPRSQLPPDTHALSTSSRTFHMFNIVPRAGRAASSLSCSARTPDHFRAGADPGRVAAARRLELPKSAPSPATASAPPVTRRDARAEALRGAEVPEVPPAARGARRD